MAWHNITKHNIRWTTTRFLLILFPFSVPFLFLSHCFHSSSCLRMFRANSIKLLILFYIVGFFVRTALDCLYLCICFSAYHSIIVFMILMCQTKWTFRKIFVNRHCADDDEIVKQKNAEKWEENESDEHAELMMFNWTT